MCCNLPALPVCVCSVVSLVCGHFFEAVGGIWVPSILPVFQDGDRFSEDAVWACEASSLPRSIVSWSRCGLRNACYVSDCIGPSSGVDSVKNEFYTPGLGLGLGIVLLRLGLGLGLGLGIKSRNLV